MTEENIVPPSEQPVRIRWLNAAGNFKSRESLDFVFCFFLEQNPTLQKPIAQYPQTPAVKINKVTAPSVINKIRTKVNLN
jgi:hypothetical protein